MNYYCNICRKTITPEEFSFSMNRYKKALCPDHQPTKEFNGTTKGLQNLMKKRHTTEQPADVPQLKTIKDWINADFDTWDKVVQKDEKEQTDATVLEENFNDGRQKRSKK